MDPERYLQSCTFSFVKNILVAVLIRSLLTTSHWNHLYNLSQRFFIIFRWFFLYYKTFKYFQTTGFRVLEIQLCVFWFFFSFLFLRHRLPNCLSASWVKRYLIVFVYPQYLYLFEFPSWFLDLGLFNWPVSIMTWFFFYMLLC